MDKQKERIKYRLTQDAKRVGRTVYLGNTKIEADIMDKRRIEPDEGE